MPTNSPINGIPYPVGSDDADMQSDMAALVGAIDTRMLPRFTDTSARDAAITSPIKGMMCYVDSFNLPMLRYSSYWGFLPGTPVAYLYRSTAQSIATGVHTSVIYDSENFDLLGGHSTSVNPERYTPPVPGNYYYTTGVVFDLNGTGVRALRVDKNAAVTFGPEQLTQPAASFRTALLAQAFASMNGTTDYITSVVFQSSGSTVNLLADADIHYRPTLLVVYAGGA